MAPHARGSSLGLGPQGGPILLGLVEQAESPGKGARKPKGFYAHPRGCTAAYGTRRLRATDKLTVIYSEHGSRAARGCFVRVRDQRQCAVREGCLFAAVLARPFSFLIALCRWLPLREAAPLRCQPGPERARGTRCAGSGCAALRCRAAPAPSNASTALAARCFLRYFARFAQLVAGRLR